MWLHFLYLFPQFWNPEFKIKVSVGPCSLWRLASGVPSLPPSHITSVSALVITWPSSCVSLLLLFLWGHLSCCVRRHQMPFVTLLSFAKTLFPNKVPLTGPWGYDFSLCLGDTGQPVMTQWENWHGLRGEGGGRWESWEASLAIKNVVLVVRQEEALRHGLESSLQGRQKTWRPTDFSSILLDICHILETNLCFSLSNQKC